MVAVIGITAQVSPMEGLYTASAVPTMKPPPTHVAETHRHTKGSVSNMLMLEMAKLGLDLVGDNKMASFFFFFSLYLPLSYRV